LQLALCWMLRPAGHRRFARLQMNMSIGGVWDDARIAVCDRRPRGLPETRPELARDVLRRRQARFGVLACASPPGSPVSRRTRSRRARVRLSSPGHLAQSRPSGRGPSIGHEERQVATREWDVPGYSELRMLGSGGFGEVVAARHDASGALVAIKYLRRVLLEEDPEFAGMFRAEPRVLASMDDPERGPAV
jgi:hypothetical protein